MDKNTLPALAASLMLACASAHTTPAPPTPGPGDGGTAAPPGANPATDTPLAHAAATPIAMHKLPLVTRGVLDVGADRGGGIWAVSDDTVFYWPTAGSMPFAYHQATDHLARSNPDYVFASVAGAGPGQAIVGNRGAIADVLQVDPSSGAVRSLRNMSVPLDAPEYAEHVTRVTAGVRAVVDPSGTWNGTAYVGGTHGFVAWHGVDGDCGCVQFEEHQHYIPPSGCDDAGPAGGCWGGDNAGLAFSPDGDIWSGDEHFVALLPQRSLGPDTDFFVDFKVAIDVWPGVPDETHALSADANGGLWVGGYGNGVAYLAPMTHAPSYWDRAKALPQDRVTTVAVDGDTVWVGTVEGGIARYDGTSWTYYTQASGLPSDEVRSIYVDTNASPRRVLVATALGVGVYDGK